MSDWWQSDISEGTWQRAMDPLELWTSPAPRGLGETPWDEAWLDATRWWADAVTRDSRGWPGMKGKLLAQIAGGLARTFRGRRIDVRIRGRTVKGRLDWVLLDRNGERYAARLHFSSVEYDGLELAFVSVAAESVDLSPPPDIAATASGIWIEAQVSGARTRPGARSRTPWTRSPTPSAAAREPRSGGRHTRAEDRPCVTRQRLSSISWARFLRKLPIALGATRGS
jgi:hypothetical protein